MNTPKATRTKNATHPIPMLAFAPAARLVESEGVEGLGLAVELVAGDVSGVFEEVFGIMTVDPIEVDAEMGAILVEAGSFTMTKLGLVEFGGLEKLSFWLDVINENSTSDIIAHAEAISA